MDAPRLSSILGRLSRFSQLYRGKESPAGGWRRARRGNEEMRRVTADSANGATDLCSLSAVVKKKKKSEEIKVTLEFCSIYLHVIAKRSNPNPLYLKGQYVDLEQKYKLQILMMTILRNNAHSEILIFSMTE